MPDSNKPCSPEKIYGEDWRDYMRQKGFDPDDPKDVKDFDRREFLRIGAVLADTNTWERSSA